MDNDTQKIFEEQLSKLPRAVVDYISSSDWNSQLDEIGSMYNLGADQLSSYKQEAAFVLAGLVHPDEFGTALNKETGLQGGVLEAVVVATEQKVFATVRALLVNFFEDEEKENDGNEAAPTTPEASIKDVVEKPTAQSSVAPANLPFAPEPEPLIPTIASKIEPMVFPGAQQIPQPAPQIFSATMSPVAQPVIIQVATQNQTVAPHPFEEKMKQVFTAAEPKAIDLSLPPVPPQATPAAQVPPITPPPAPAGAAAQPASNYRADPYREPIE